MSHNEKNKMTNDASKTWREQSYSQAYDTTYMYSARMSEADHKKKKSSFGKFVRAACLVVICALISALASYGVFEYRLSRGDFNLPTPTEGSGIIIAGGNNDSNIENLIVPPSVPSDGIAAEDIYQMALSQVVGIRTNVPSLGLFRDAETTTPLSGSGFIISRDGYILTNFHVVEIGHINNLPIIVSLHNGDEFEAEVIGFDALNDVALIKINATGLSPAILGNSDNIRVGQRIYAIGNPFGELVYTMTDGIVSALDRIVTVERNIINTFQISAAVNSGNSGGPVYNTDGEVIGIVTAKMMRSTVEGIGFAIPINDAVVIANDLIEHGYIRGRAFFGITPQTVGPGHADFYETPPGVLILGVIEDSAAERAGMQEGDVITKIDGIDVSNVESLRFALRRFNSGDTTTVEVWREGEAMELTITFDEDLQAGQPNR